MRGSASVSPRVRSRITARSKFRTSYKPMKTDTMSANWTDLAILCAVRQHSLTGAHNARMFAPAEPCSASCREPPTTPHVAVDRFAALLRWLLDADPRIVVVLMGIGEGAEAAR